MATSFLGIYVFIGRFVCSFFIYFCNKKRDPKIVLFSQEKTHFMKISDLLSFAITDAFSKDRPEEYRVLNIQTFS